MRLRSRGSGARPAYCLWTMSCDLFNLDGDFRSLVFQGKKSLEQGLSVACGGLLYIRVLVISLKDHPIMPKLTKR